MDTVETSTLGIYNDIPKGMPAEGDVSITVKTIDMVTNWKRCGILANFVSIFYASAQNNESTNENTISTILNELLENAVKYSVKRNAEIALNTRLYDSILLIEINNRTSERHFFTFKNFLETTIDNDNLDELYLEKLLQKDEGVSESGIGLILLLKDYGVNIGAKLQHNTDTDSYSVSIQAKYHLEQ